MAARITAIGVLSAYGAGMTALVQGIRAGPAPLLPAGGIGYPTEPPPLVNRFAPALRGVDDSPLAPGEGGARAALLQTVEQMLSTVDGDAVDGSAVSGSAAMLGDDCALLVGSGGFLYASNAELYWRDRLAAGGAASATDAGFAAFRVRGPGWGVQLITARWRLSGPALTLSTGCSSSANALLTALRWIARGRVRRAIVVGAEGLSAVTLAGFDSLLLLDPHGCRPFDRDRAGVQLGEAVAVLMLEADGGQPGSSMPAAAAAPDRGATLLGAANLCDTHHLTGASPDGSVMAQVMRGAIADAGLAIGDIVLIKAHGTGSADSDAAEARAIDAVFGAQAPPVTALKRYFGHTLGACGTLETAALIGCVDAGFVPAAAGFARRDPDLPIEPMRSPCTARDGAYLLNFFGFGGNYTSLVLKLRAGGASP